MPAAPEGEASAAAAAAASALTAHTVVEFPGVLRSSDPTRAIAALGGTQSFRAALLSRAALTINLRPGARNSPSNIAAEPPARAPNLFVLEVVADAQPRARVVGEVTAVYAFRALADFQFHVRHMAAPAVAAVDELEAAAETMFQLATRRGRGVEESREGYLIDRLRPARFVRGQREYGNTEYWFRQYGVNTDAVSLAAGLIRERGRKLGEDRRSDANRLIALSHRISADAESVPQGPADDCKNPPVVRGVESFHRLCAILNKRFCERPVWIRRALHDGIPKALRKSFKRAITTVAYSFQGPGPFHQAWIRYGYDPRKNPASRSFQVIEIRCNHPLLRVAIKERRRDPPDDEPSDGEFKLPEAYTLSHVPLHKNNFVQVCDISIPAAVEFCESEPGQGVFDKKYGFFSEEGHQKLVRIIKGALVDDAILFLGKERADRILEPYTSTEAPKRKRARTSLGQVMKPKVHGKFRRVAAKRSAARVAVQKVPGAVAVVQDLPIAEREGVADRLSSYDGDMQPEDKVNTEEGAGQEEGETKGVEEEVVGRMGVEEVEEVEEEGAFAEVEGYEILGDDDSDDCDNDDEDDDEDDDDDDDDADF